MANVIIQDERRQADIEYVAKKYGIDTNNPAMREAAEVTAVRSREAMEMGRTQRRYYTITGRRKEFHSLRGIWKNDRL